MIIRNQKWLTPYSTHLFSKLLTVCDILRKTHRAQIFAIFNALLRLYRYFHAHRIQQPIPKIRILSFYYSNRIVFDEKALARPVKLV